MPQANISFNVPDEKVADLVAAINWRWPAYDENGLQVDRTPAEALAFLKSILVSELEKTYRNYKRREAELAADSDITLE